MGIDQKGQSDVDVIHRVLNGDREAFGILVERYASIFYAYAYNLCKDYDTAADLVQEGLIAAYNSLDRLRNPGIFCSWVVKIIKNKYRDLGRKKSVPTIPLEQLKETGFEPSDSDTSQPHSKEDLSFVMKCVDSLPEKYREVTLLKYIEDMSYQTISNILNLPVTTVATRLVYARRLLIKMAKEGGLL